MSPSSTDSRLTPYSPPSHHFSSCCSCSCSCCAGGAVLPLHRREGRWRRAGGAGAARVLRAAGRGAGRGGGAVALPRRGGRRRDGVARLARPPARDGRGAAGRRAGRGGGALLLRDGRQGWPCVLAERPRVPARAGRGRLHHRRRQGAQVLQARGGAGEQGRAVQPGGDAAAPPQAPPPPEERGGGGGRARGRRRGGRRRGGRGGGGGRGGDRGGGEKGGGGGGGGGGWRWRELREGSAVLYPRGAAGAHSLAAPRGADAPARAGHGALLRHRRALLQGRGGAWAGACACSLAV